MTKAELRQAKADLHKIIVDEVLSKGGTMADDIEMYKYVIELATNELCKNVEDFCKTLSIGK